MSKITPKNLSYDTSLPPFLQRMQAANAASSRDGRHEFSIARPKRARDPDDERDDEPVYFDAQSGDTLTKGEWEARELEKEKAEQEGEGEEEDGIGAVTAEDKEKDKNKEKDKETLAAVAAIGASRKKKAGKVVGGDAVEQDGAKDAEPKELRKAEKSKAKPARKGKKIKLSFGDDE
ncbi:hypothetical protein PVAG01_05566 [Phlyctema vagabunda]|uniref:DUF4604 domain-containing protein n=1 Tax=Phlyctema vagabunda TaxID=108571 RepID=A0ABR4PKH1_9HELO